MAVITSGCGYLGGGSGGGVLEVAGEAVEFATARFGTHRKRNRAVLAVCAL